MIYLKKVRRENREISIEYIAVYRTSKATEKMLITSTISGLNNVSYPYRVNVLC